ncbi:hypothetical protein MKW92_051521 [Papaver armeniacum]|nr:hypothetical protein MKW92_051521 [Papaver armeniacum]
MAKPAASLLFLGFCLVLVMSMSSQGVNALTCEISGLPVFDPAVCKTACERDSGASFVSSGLVLVNSLPGCQCCHN